MGKVLKISRTAKLTMKQERLDKIIEDHAKYKAGVQGGRKANFANETLKGLTIHTANLNEAIFVNCVIDGCTFYNSKMNNTCFMNTHIINSRIIDSVLENADFTYSRIKSSNLRTNWLHKAKFNHAEVKFSDFSGSKLSNAVLINTDLTMTNLTACDLNQANLDGVFITQTIGNGEEIKTIQIEGLLKIVYTDEVMAIGGRQYPIKKWWNYTDEQIATHYVPDFLKVWKKWRPILQAIGVFDKAIEELKEEIGLDSHIEIDSNIFKKKDRKIIVVDHIACMDI